MVPLWDGYVVHIWVYSPGLSVHLRHGPLKSLFTTALLDVKLLGIWQKSGSTKEFLQFFFRKKISILLVIVKNFLLDYKNFVQQRYVWQVTLFCMHNLNTSWAWQQFHLTSKVFEKTQFSTEYKVMFEIFLLQHSHISVIVNND